MKEEPFKFDVCCWQHLVTVVDIAVIKVAFTLQQKDCGGPTAWPPRSNHNGFLLLRSSSSRLGFYDGLNISGH